MEGKLVLSNEERNNIKGLLSEVKKLESFEKKIVFSQIGSLVKDEKDKSDDFKNDLEKSPRLKLIFTEIEKLNYKQLIFLDELYKSKVPVKKAKTLSDVIDEAREKKFVANLKKNDDSARNYASNNGGSVFN